MIRDRPCPKPNKSLFLLIHKALNSKFYLIQETGPLAVVLKSQSGKIFKVGLGNSHCCTCGGGVYSHCVHTLYVLIRIFKVGLDSPLLWQLSFLDTEILWIIQNRKNFLGEVLSIPESVEIKEAVRLNPEEEECAICQDSMSFDDNLVYCKTGCGHNFHRDCMEIWGSHKVSSGTQLNCPMCRSEWGLLALQELKKTPMRGPQRICHDKNAPCNGCYQFPIRVNIHRCLECPKTYFCKRCANIDHQGHHFLVRKTHRHKWESLNGKPIHDYLFSIFVETEARKCCYCTSLENDFLILACGHSAHKRCLYQKLKAEIYTCEIDGQSVLKGIEVVQANRAEKPPVHGRTSSMANQEENEQKEAHEEHEEHEEQKNIERGNFATRQTTDINSSKRSFGNFSREKVNSRGNNRSFANSSTPKYRHNSEVNPNNRSVVDASTPKSRNNLDVCPNDRSFANVSNEVSIAITPKGRSVANVTRDTSNAPKERSAPNVPKERFVPNAPKERSAPNVPKERFAQNAPKERSAANVSRERSAANVPKERFALNVPKERSSTNAPKEKTVANVLKERADLPTTNISFTNTPKERADSLGINRSFGSTLLKDSLPSLTGNKVISTNKLLPRLR